MDPNQVYHTADAQRNLDFARERAFGELAVSEKNGPEISYIPFVLSEAGETLDLHLVRSNPIARILTTPLKAKIAISGGDSYISPDWYEVDDQVPTLNYVPTHLTGILELQPQEEMRELLDRQTSFFEEQLRPTEPWRAAKINPDVLDKMMRQIVPCRLAITAVDGTWKLSQNKPDPVRMRAADGVAAYGLGTDLGVLAALVRRVK